MLVAANVAIEYLKDLDLEGLAAEPMRFDAIVANIIRIGEAAARIIDEEEHLQPQLPWLRMIGMRNIIVHRYFETSLETVYETTRFHLPELVGQLRLVLGEEA